jgi:hypothetical protein
MSEKNLVNDLIAEEQESTSIFSPSYFVHVDKATGKRVGVAQIKINGEPWNATVQDRYLKLILQNQEEAVKTLLRAREMAKAPNAVSDYDAARAASAARSAAAKKSKAPVVSDHQSLMNDL